MAALPEIRVASIQLAEKLVRDQDWDWVVSIGEGGRSHVRPEQGHYLPLDMSDLNEWAMYRIARQGGPRKTTIQPPTPERVAPVLAAAHEMHGRVLIHCHAGWCRSPAIALSILAARMGRGREFDAANRLKAIHPPSLPNSLIVRIADELLFRGGALYRAMGVVFPNSLPRKRTHPEN